jgi:outer membrane protein assembly factor BamB
MSQGFIRASFIGLILLSCQLANAATFNGTVESVSVDDKSVTIKLNGKKEETKTFTLAGTVVILVDGKKATFEDVSEGQTAVVVANTSNEALKLTLKTPKTPPASKKPPKRTDSNDSPASAETGFWPQFRGPNRDNISTETGLLSEWEPGGPKLLWEQKNLGEAFSSIAIAEGKLFTLGNQGNSEVLLCMNAADGKPLWSVKFGTAYRNGMGNGPRGTPTVDADRVYALGANGDLVCVGVDNGEIVWQKNILREYGGDNITWGISESVLIDGKQLICCPGGKQATIVGLDKLSGRGIWRSMIDGKPQASYSSAIIVESGNERVIVNYVHTGVVGIRAKNGDVLWGFPASANGTANCSSPVFDDGMVFTASGYGTGCAMFKLGAGGKASLAYSNKEMKNHHGGMVVVDGHVYGFDEQILKCIDMKSGDTVWQNRSVGKGSLTCADGHLYLRSEGGPMALCTLTPKGYEEKGRFEPKNRSDKPAWAYPVVCGGRLYLRDMDSLAVYDVKK